MLRTICRFFKDEPKYFWLLCALLVFYAFFFFVAQPHEAGKKHSKKAVAFHAAEQKWNEAMEREETFREFAKQKPVPALLFQALTFFFFLAFLAGMVIDVFLLWKPSLRERFTSALSPPQSQGWPFSILFKVTLLFVLWGVLLSLLMGMVRAIFPQCISDNFFMVLHTLLLDLIALYFMIKFLKQKGSRWQELGFQVPPGGVLREIGVGVMGYLGALPFFAGVVVLLLAVSSLIHCEPPSHPLVDVFLEEDHTSFLLLISFLLGAVIGPIFEEIFFRGFCYPIFRNKWGKFWAAGLSAAFFAGIHHSGFMFLPIFVLGVALAYLYEKRKSLIAPITFHIIHNTLFITYFFLVKQILGGRGI